jgi:cytochrome c biogenesis protein CcmG, thiol:disulfide interchange protein DsbE
MRAVTGRVMLGLAALACLGAAKPKVDQPAPPFTLTLMDGTKIKSDQLRGNVVVLNFWATWCAPCREELPTLDVYAKLRAKYGLRVFAVATEDSASPYSMRKLFAALSLTPVRRISSPYDIIDGGVPTNYVIDRAGRVRYAKAAAFDLDSLNEILTPLLREPAPAETTPPPTAS